VLGLALVAWGTVRGGCDRWWWGTLLLYGPLWALALPALVLLPFAAIWRGRLLWPLTISLLVIAGPVMGLQIRFDFHPTDVGGPPSRLPSLRVMTFNGDGTRDPVMLLRLLEREAPDVVALQEWADHEEASDALTRLGWHVARHGALVLLSRFPIESAERMPSEEGWRNIAVRYTLRTPSGIVRVCNVHLETPRWGIEAVWGGGRAGLPQMRENTARRWRESDAVSRALAREGGGHVIAGDFNMPVESAVYQRFWSNCTNAFTSAGWGYGRTKRLRWWGTRIDHVLAGPGWIVRSCRVLEAPTGSSHRPVLAELSLGLPGRDG
jgi:vancomycin resistance protein VanJ